MLSSPQWLNTTQGNLKRKKKEKEKEKDGECSRRNNQPLNNYSLALSFLFFGISNKELMQEHNQKLFQYFILDF